MESFNRTARHFKIFCRYRIAWLLLATTIRPICSFISARSKTIISLATDNYIKLGLRIRVRLGICIHHMSYIIFLAYYTSVPPNSENNISCMIVNTMTVNAKNKS